MSETQVFERIAQEARKLETDLRRLRGHSSCKKTCQRHAKYGLEETLGVQIQSDSPNFSVRLKSISTLLNAQRALTRATAASTKELRRRR